MSGPQPNAQTLWFNLLTGTRTIQIPGVVIGRAAVLADDLGWELESFRKAFDEVVAKGFAVADWDVGLVVLHRALIDSTGAPRESNRPANPNVLKSWAKAWDDIPECSLKCELLQTLASFAKALGKTYQVAFAKAFTKALAKAYPNASPKQDTGYRKQETGDRNQDRALSAREVDPPIASIDPDPRATERREILGRVHECHRQAYERIRVEVGSSARPMGLVGDPAERALAKHLLELVTLETAEADCRHVLAVREAEAIRKRTVQFLGSSVWSQASFARAMTTSPSEQREDLGVGRYEPPARSEYGDGDQSL